MIELKYVNVNPKGRKTGDCSTRALVGVLGVTYEQALKMQCEEAIKSCYGITDKQVMERVLKRYGYIKMKQPRKEDGKKYTVGELDEILTKKQIEEGVLVTVARHHTCIKNGCVQDIWDCRVKTVVNYYVKA